MQTKVLGLDPNEVQALAAIGNILLTLGLLVFAGAQVWVTRRQLQLQQKSEDHDAQIEQDHAERQKKLDDAVQDAAIAAIRAEQVRLYNEFRHLEAPNFIETVVQGIIKPETFEIDGGYLMAQFAHLGFLPSRIGATAILQINSVAKSLDTIDRLVQRIAGAKPRDTEYMMHQVLAAVPLFSSRVRDVRDLMLEALLTLDDALACTKRATVRHTLNWPKVLASKTANDLRDRFPGAACDLDMSYGHDHRKVNRGVLKVDNTE